MKTQKGTFRKLFEVLGRQKLIFAVSITLAALNVALTLYIPVLIGDAIDCIIGKGNVDFDAIITIIIKAGVTIGLAAISQWLMSICNNKMTFTLVHDLRSKAFKKVQKLPLSYIDTHPYGDVVSRVISDVDTLSDGLLMGFTQLFTGVATVLGTVVLMFSINWKIALIVVVLTPASLLVAKFISDRTYSMFKKQSETRGEQTAFIDETVGNQKVIEAFCHGDEATEKFTEINERLRKYSLRAIFFSSMVNPSTRIINAIIYALVCLVGALTVISDPLFTVGALSVLLSYASQYAKPFNEISGVITELAAAKASADRVFDFLEQAEEISDENNTEMPTAEGNVKMDNISFSYTPEKPLIDGITLNFESGQQIAIVGPTGCGKTTLINLLMRFYDVTDGKISVDGYDIKDVTRHSLRENYGMVLQETWLKSGTIRENITMGNPDATDEEIIAAARSTHAHSFIKRLPQGYDTVIGEDGGNLSEGQKQLLCITRVMLCLPPMLILDEATSSIDVKTEMHIQHAFARLMKGRTSFVVAHRLSTIKHSDVILVMRDGNIIEHGNHKELLKAKGFYYELYNSQFAN
ncbi:MAG: ABC transporter ATP-binding protein [Clostridia bacterium]|nr:ABC transporter ATP-binding protein [Clostridia bacterium]